MPPTRRHILLGGLAVATLPRPTLAQMAIGTGALTTVSDGHLVLPAFEPLPGVPPEEHAALAQRFGLSAETREPPCNVTLWQDADRTVLFDVGSGQDFLPTAGDLLANLDAAGIAPEHVTDVLFTHAHPDHLWGLFDDFGDIAFPNAAFQIGRTEWDYWTDPATIDSIGELRQSFAVGAARRLAEIEDRIAFFEDGDEVLPGIQAVATFGHTPGHMAFELRQNGTGVMVLGDAITNAQLDFARPLWPAANDQDPDKAAATRAALLDRLVADQTALIGFHLPGGGFGHAERDGDAYRFVPRDG